MNQEKNEVLQEEQHLQSCLDIIKDNIRMYEEKERNYRKEVTQLFQAVKKGEGDSYGQLIAGQDLLEHTENMLRKSRAALKKAYFGRIDYDDLTYGVKESCYIGKNGITAENNDVVIVDWRAPVSSVYYENELGTGRYPVPENDPVDIILHKKRTYDIQEEQFHKQKQQQYKKYFDSSGHKWTELMIYQSFLERISRQSKEDWRDTIEHVSQGELDIYDTAALALIWKRILMKKGNDEFSQIIIDEAQDFGESVYYVMKQILSDCYFTIMGDVSQNIRYETGMNDWDRLKEVLFTKEQDSFYLLSKSYRNTIEISQCAGNVLEKASQGSYKIQPVIRHGQEVQIIKKSDNHLLDALKNVLTQVQQKGFETIAVICRTEEEAHALRESLSLGNQTETFHNGIMILPVTLTKGLEFDIVILWKPDEDHYSANAKDAKLLYVAITRALHELYLIGTQEPSSLFQ